MIKKYALILLPVCVVISIFFSGCAGYSSESLYPQEIKSVYVEMFDNATFRRDLEYALTDALAKRIDSETPYRIISDYGLADTVLSGKITSISEHVLTTERSSARALEEQAEVKAVFSWKNLKTGQYILENEKASATASYSEFMQQGFEYGSQAAANKLAQSIVEHMQKDF